LARTAPPSTLFSLELLVEYIRVEKNCKILNELALGVTLLNFPTLLIYHSNNPGHNEKEKPGMFAFNRGKCCFFKMDLNSLHVQLSNTPLYGMVLDVTEESPKLVGSCMISLAKAMDRISPSYHIERGLVVSICNLAGEKVGAMSLSYKLLCLGASLLPHITERERVPGGQQAQEHVKETNKSTSQPPDSGNVCSPTPQCSGKAQSKGEVNAEVLLSKDRKEEEDDDVFDGTEHRPQDEAENDSEEDLTVFCPPHLYYSAEEKGVNEQGDYKSWTLDSEAPVFEDSCSEEEVDEKEVESPSSPVMHSEVRHDAKIRNQETSTMPPNVLGEALQRMPLLNALLVELSQLNSSQPLTVHPSLAWIYRPASAELSAKNTPQKAQTKSLKKTKQETFPHLRRFHSSRNVSTHIVRPDSVKLKDKKENMLLENKSSCKSPRKKLVCGTTKTFNLRLKQISPLRVNRRECEELKQNKTQVNEKTGLGHKTIKSGKRKSVIKRSSDFNENIETLMQSISRDSALQETVTLKQHVKVEGKQCRGSPTTSEKALLSETLSKCIHIPSVDTDSVPQSKDKSEHHSESDQSQSESDRRGDKIESSRSRRRSSSKSSFSDSSWAGNEEADYVDDFNSLEPSDAYSPDPLNSPEPSRAKTPKSPVRFWNSDSESDSVQRRSAPLPVPIKAPSSPKHTLRGTHIIRPRTQTSALSCSSDECDRDRSASLQSRKQMSASGRVEMTSCTESLMSSRGQTSALANHSIPIRGLSADSVSSVEPQEVEELEDELGSLDFRKEYQHISELVASKLPGYTM
uniref:Microtubule-associated protein 10 C-terminal domain-containing protein n=1 Tax=Astatotilapia calliptera TaxID=8154 RepID=A0A3P8QXU7_ASTCA